MNTVLFFATAIGVGIIAHFAMKWLDKRNPHTQRITIVSMAFCFAMAYIAEAYFGIADITGAYIAGIVLCTLEDAPMWSAGWTSATMCCLLPSSSPASA